MNNNILTQKIRADEALVQLGLCQSREQAKRFIMAGEAILLLPLAKTPKLVDKPGQILPVGSALSLKEKERFVSRGGYKLLTAIEAFNFNAQGLVCLDVGASTGGFTDCLLQHGATKVYAVDVGVGQLDIKLRGDERVITMEGVNLRNAPPNLIPEPVEMVVIDVSFISLTLIIPPAISYLRQGGLLTALIKPQFELGPHATKKGVVHSPELQQEAVDKITLFCKNELLLEEIGIVPAKIKGPKGNQEYLASFVKK